MVGEGRGGLPLFEQGLEDVAEAEGGATVDLVVDGFPGMGQETGALFAIPGNDGTFNGPVEAPCGAGGQTSFEGWISKTEFHDANLLNYLLKI